MAYAIFIDGPLAGEHMNIKMLPLMGVFEAPIPERITFCDCDPSYMEEISRPPENFEYYVIAKGEHLMILSKEKNAVKAIVSNVKEIIQSDFGRKQWRYHCSDRRAFE